MVEIVKFLCSVRVARIELTACVWETNILFISNLPHIEILIS
jgi:hypothetical protein